MSTCSIALQHALSCVRLYILYLYSYTNIVQLLRTTLKRWVSIYERSTVIGPNWVTVGQCTMRVRDIAIRGGGGGGSREGVSKLTPWPNPSIKRQRVSLKGVTIDWLTMTVVAVGISVVCIYISKGFIVCNGHCHPPPSPLCMCLSDTLAVYPSIWSLSPLTTVLYCPFLCTVCPTQDVGGCFLIIVCT